jgi:hypothetical protein
VNCVRFLVARSIVNNSYWPVLFDCPQNTTDFPSGLQAGVTSPRSAGGFPGTGLTGFAGVNYAHVQTTASFGLDYGGGGLALTFFNTTDFADGTTFDLFSFNGAPTGTLAAIYTYYSLASSSYRNAIFTSDGNGVWTSQQLANNQQLRFTEATGQLQMLAAVPEPSTWALATVGAGFLGWMAHRRVADRRRLVARKLD